MAIPAMSPRRESEWTRSSRAQAGAALALAIGALALGYLSFQRYMHKRSFDKAVLYHESNRSTLAVPALQEALSWDASNHEARMLLAKLRVETGDLDGADAEYARVESSAFDRKALVHCGRGIVALRRADREMKGADAAAEWKIAEPHLQKAREHFGRAQKADAALLEAEIGLRHCDLFAVRHGRDSDTGKRAALADAFKKLEGRVTGDAAKSISREGLVDLYAGVGWAHMTTGDMGEAARRFRRCALYAPRRALSRVNMVYLEARRFAETSFSLKDLTEMKVQIQRERKELQGLWKGRDPSYAALQEPWFQYALATAWAFARAGDMDLYRNFLNDAMQDPRHRVRHEPALLEAVVMAGPAFDAGAAPSPRNTAVGALGMALSALGKNEEFKKGASPARRAAVLHNLGCVEEQAAAYNNRDAQYDRAIDLWKQALAIEESYETCRNIAVVQKRRKKEGAQEWYERALKLAAGAGDDARRDAEDLRKHWEGP